MCLAPGTKPGSSVALDGTDAPPRKAAQMMAASISDFIVRTEAIAACRQTQLFRLSIFPSHGPTAKPKFSDWLSTGSRTHLPTELLPSILDC